MNPPAAPARVAIVLVNWKAWRDCIECLSSIAGSGALAQADVWLVDNDSGDRSVERIAAWCQSPQPEGAGARLDGVRHHPAGVPLPCRVWPANGEPAPLLPGVQVNLVQAGGNLGFAGGNNVGMASTPTP
jgi:GT2 family glycosyltransferase